LTTSDNLLNRLEKDNSLPLYQQIKNNIREKITGNLWPPEMRLPSENDLVDKLGVSRMTVHRALRELTQEGLLNRVHGLGTFVAKPARHASLIRLQDIADEIRSTGSSYRCKILGMKTIKAARNLADSMEVDIGAELFHLRAVHFQDDLPIQLEDRLVNPRMAPAFIKQDFRIRTTTEYLISLIKPDEMEHIVQAILPDQRTARALSIESSQPCLRLTRRTWKDRQIVTRVALIYPSNRYDLGERYLTDQYPVK